MWKYIFIKLCILYYEYNDYLLYKLKYFICNKNKYLFLKLFEYTFFTIYYSNKLNFVKI